MNWYQIFYWLTVADNAKIFFIVFMSIFTAISLIATIWFIVDRDSEDGSVNPNRHAAEKAKHWMWWSYPFMIVFWALFILTPSKKGILLIVAGGGTMEFLSTDSAARQLPSEMTNFVLTELKQLSKEAKVDLGIASQKDKILEEAKKMTTDQLLDKMKSDTTFAKIILKK